MMDRVDVPSYLNARGYVSSIKIAGIPILPPLVTDERKQELNEDRFKAIAIEIRLKRKRSSIDSGVMTGSYIDTLKSSDLTQAGKACDRTLSTEPYLNEPASIDIPPSVLNDSSSESFLMTALQDPQFREYFCSTADRIFNENGRHIIGQHYSLESSIFHNTDSNSQGCYEGLSLSTNPILSDHLPDSNVCFSDIEVSGLVNQDGNGDSSSSLEAQDCNGIKITEMQSELTRSRVRRNSYTLESPSPVLLELMVRENTEVSLVKNKTNKSLQPNTNMFERNGPGFKTFTCTKKPRKTWNKKSFEPSCVPKPEKAVNRDFKPSFIRRAKTMVKPLSKRRNLNNSLPTSSRASPTHHLSRFTQSVDSMLFFEGKSFCKGSQVLPHPIQEMKTPQIEKSEFAFKNYFFYDKKALSFQKKMVSERDGNLDSSLVQNMTNLSLLNNTSGSLHSINDTSCESSHIGVNDATSQVSDFSQSINHRTVSQTDTIKNAIGNKINPYLDANESISVTPKIIHEKNKNHPCVVTDDRISVGYHKVKNLQTEPFADIDDTISVTSSLSLSKFLPLDNGDSGPPVSDEKTDLFVELQLAHEKQLKDLLEKQHREKLFLSRMQSMTGMSARSGTSLSACTLSFEQDFFTEQFVSPGALKTSRNSLSRELFPVNNDVRDIVQQKHQKDVFEAQKRAAMIITAFARGYLTRRLMRTEKVRQQIELIKESLTCGLKLQMESKLKKKDFELLERLENQLMLAFLDLHATLSAPVHKRMHLIAQDRERLRRPVSRPSSTISSATQKSILRRQRSGNFQKKKSEETRARTKSLGRTPSYSPAFVRSASFVKSDCSSSNVESKQRNPWR